MVTPFPTEEELIRAEPQSREMLEHFRTHHERLQRDLYRAKRRVIFTNKTTDRQAA